MKKRVLCIFSIIFFLLIVCTVLSFEIEDTMMTRVRVKQVSPNLGEVSMPLSALFYDDFGNHLFILEEGTGWESGHRVVELKSDTYSIDEVRNTVYINSYISTQGIITATRQPIAGSEVEILDPENRAPDDLLLYYPVERTTSGSFPSGVTMTALGNNAMLLSAEKTPQPYMEHQAKTWLEWQEMPMWRIYSLTEVTKFLGEMPAVALLVALILLGVIIWGYSCVLAKDPWENRVALWTNVGIGVAILCCLPLVINAIDLPWSLLPAENILDFNHYRTEFEMVFAGLKDLGDCSQALNVMQKADGALYASLGVLLAGILSGVGVIVAEYILIRRKKER